MERRKTLSAYDPRNFIVSERLGLGASQREQATTNQPGEPNPSHSGQAGQMSGARPKTKIRTATLTEGPFVIWPVEMFQKAWALCQKRRNHTPLGVLFILQELWFTGFKRNPVKLTTCALRKFGISRLRKYRALQLLEEGGFISVERTPGKNPLVTMTWLPIKEHIRE
jgi:hypothetical protein